MSGDRGTRQVSLTAGKAENGLHFLNELRTGKRKIVSANIN